MYFSLFQSSVRRVKGTEQTNKNDARHDCINCVLQIIHSSYNFLTHVHQGSNKSIEIFAFWAHWKIFLEICIFASRHCHGILQLSSHILKRYILLCVFLVWKVDAMRSPFFVRYGFTPDKGLVFQWCGRWRSGIHGREGMRVTFTKVV